MRRALAYAIDRKAFIDGVLSGYGAPIGSHYVPQDPGYIDLTGTYPFDAAKAKPMLAEAGVQPGFSMTISLPPPAYARRGGEVIAAMLQQVGINAKLVPIEWAQWLDQVFARSDFDATIIAHTEARDLDIYARDKYYFNYHSPEYKALYTQYLADARPEGAARSRGPAAEEAGRGRAQRVPVRAAQDRRVEREAARAVGQQPDPGERRDGSDLGGVSAYLVQRFVTLVLTLLAASPRRVPGAAGAAGRSGGDHARH